MKIVFAAKIFNLTLFLTGMKVYEMHENELILEPAMKWAGNPNIMVAIKAFGLKATVQVTIYIFGPNVCENKFLSSPLLLLLKGGGSASFCRAADYLEATGSQFSLFCKHFCLSYGKGL